MITTISLSPGVTLRCFQDRRFKQGCITVQFLRRMCREEAAMNALLPSVLLRGCVQAPDMQKITARLDDLYGASVADLVRRVGDYQTTGLSCGFMEDRFALGSDRIFEPTVAFLSQLLLHPVTENGVFCREFVESEKRNLVAAIAARRNDKRLYCADRLMDLMCQADSFGIPRTGTAEDVEAITAESLWQHYQTVLAESPVHIFYVGSQEPQAVAENLSPLFSSLARNHCPLPAQTGFLDGGGCDEEEVLDVAQGKLAMGYTTPITLRCDAFPAMQVCNTVLGAGMTSKLFMQVREAQSLCYDIGSGYHGSKGIVAVSAGIDFDKKDLVIAQVQKQLDDCVRGNISHGELLAAKQALVASLRGIHDTPGGIERFYATAALSGLTLSPAAYMEAVDRVDVSDVSQAAATLKLHSVFFLKGVR